MNPKHPTLYWNKMNSLYHCRQVSNIVCVKRILKVVPSPQMWLCRWHLVRILSFSTAVQVDQLSPLHPESHLKRSKIYIFVILIWFWVVIFLIIFLHNAVSIGYIYTLHTEHYWPPNEPCQVLLTPNELHWLPLTPTKPHWPPTDHHWPLLSPTDKWWPLKTPTNSYWSPMTLLSPAGLYYTLLTLIEPNWAPMPHNDSLLTHNDPCLSHNDPYLASNHPK